MKKLLITLFASVTMISSSCNIVSCNANYKKIYDNIIEQLNNVNEINLYNFTSSTSLEDSNNIFAIKNAAGISLSEMNYVYLQPINSDEKLLLNKPIEINFEIRVLNNYKIIKKSVIWNSQINGDISNLKINNSKVLRNGNTYLMTDKGYYKMIGPFSVTKVITNLFDNDVINDIYNSINGDIYVATNTGLFYSNNGVYFKKINIVVGQVYKIIQIYDGSFFLDVDNQVYHWNNKNEYNKISQNYFVNKIEKYNNVVYVLTDSYVFIINDLSLSLIPDSRFSSLENIRDIKWIDSNDAFIISIDNNQKNNTKDQLWYYKNIANNNVLVKISNSMEGNSLGDQIYSFSKIQDINNYIFLATSNGIFYSKISNFFVLQSLSLKYSLGYTKLFSCFPYTIFFSGNILGVTTIVLPVSLILEGNN